VPLAPGMSALPDPADDPLAHPASEPLVPILLVDDGQADPVALATWHQALSNTVSVEVPHDLMGLWLYPSPGGVVLLGPPELAEDDLAIPLPSPHIKPEQLQQLESVVVEAGYKSVTCLPVRFGRRDVALLLVADLRADRHGAVERVLLQCVAQRIAPMLGRIARLWKGGAGSASPQQERIAGLLRVLAQANREAATPQRFVAQVSRGVGPLLPHEHLELLLADGARNRYLRLGEHPGGALWGDPSLVIDGKHLNIAGIFGDESSLIAEDIYDDPRWPRGFLIAGDQGGADIRSVAGARLQLRNGTSAYLLAGSVGPDLYTQEDAELLSLLAGLVTPQIAAFIPREAPPVEPPKRPDPHPHLELLVRIAGLLATTPSSSVATELIAADARATIPFDALGFALRVPNSDQVVLLSPGETRPLTGLKPVSVAETALARVLRGDLPCAFEQEGKDCRMIVPLRVGGRVQGALVFSAESSGVLTEQHVVPAQHLADLLAPHLELWLRSAGSSKPAPAPARARPLPAYPATPRVVKRLSG
jgi:GAF domain-containing protein